MPRRCSGACRLTSRGCESRMNSASGDQTRSAAICCSMQSWALVFARLVEGFYAEAIAEMNASDAPVIGVDIPSGADADGMAPDTASLRARADGVVTFTAPRPAHVFAELTLRETEVCAGSDHRTKRSSPAWD